MLKGKTVIIVSGWFWKPRTDWSMRAGSWLRKAGYTVLTDIARQDEADLIIIGMANVRGWQALIKESNRRKTLLLRRQGWSPESEKESLEAGFGGLQKRCDLKDDFLRVVNEFVDQL